MNFDITHIKDLATINVSGRVYMLKYSIVQLDTPQKHANGLPYIML